MNTRKMITVLFCFLFSALFAQSFYTTAYAAMPYRIEVDITNQIVTVYSTSDKQIVRQMLCSTGADDSTPLGTFTMPEKEYPDERKEWYYFRAHDVYAKYATRVYKGIMFHSIPYNYQRDSSICKQDVEDFGKPASHGCIRLRWQDAKFIAEKCKAGTKVKIFKSGERDDDLRELLMHSSYTGENGQTYREYLGIPDEEGVLNRYSKGKEVENLQYRLRDLGIFSGDVNGEFTAPTVNAVKQAQALMGIEETGYANLEFREIIYSDQAPVAMNVTLKEGTNGPVVTLLQENLTTLRLYEGRCDGVYDLDVIEAVKHFQKAYGFTVNGVSSSLLQKAIIYEAGKVEKLFVMNEDYELEYTEETIYMGRIDTQSGIRLREQPTVDSDVLARMTDGDIVFALEYGSTWSKVQFDGNVGYIKNDYADYFKQEIAVMTYFATDADRVYSIGHTAQEYRSGASIPAKVFEDYVISDGSLDNYDGIAEFVTVCSGEGLLMNLRKTPSTNSQVLAVLPDGTQAKVILRSSEWTLVTIDGQDGYLLNEYLEFWQGPEDALDAAEKDRGDYPFEADSLYAVVQPAYGDKAPVYDIDSEDAEILGQLPAGYEVEVIESIGGWSMIGNQVDTGYMKDTDLAFVTPE